LLSELKAALQNIFSQSGFLISFSKTFILLMPLIVLAGYTGSGKTDILHLLQQLGHQVINLEELAAHNGSVFGHLPHTKILFIPQIFYQAMGTV
jgi:hypothetical protein